MSTRIKRPQFRIGRNIIYAIVLTTIVSLTAVGLGLTAFSFYDGVYSSNGDEARLVSAVYAAPAPTCVPPPPGMVAWWPGDDNAEDLIGPNDGQLVNGAAYAPGMVANGFRFFGGESAVVVPDSPTWDLGYGEFTIDTWVKLNSQTVSPEQPGPQALVAHDDGGGFQNKWVFWLNGGQLQLHYNDTAGQMIYIGVPFVPEHERWYHFAVTRTGPLYRFYVDGVQVGGDQFDQSAVPNASAPLTIGKAEAIPSTFGQIDEVEIFQRALVQTELQGIFNAGSAGKCKTQQQQCTPPPPQMIGWWPGDGNYTDIILGHNGTPAGGAAFAEGKVAQAFSFIGQDDYVTLPSIPEMNFGTGDFTFDFWERSSNSNSRMNALTFLPSYPDSNLVFDFNDPDDPYQGIWVYWNSNGGNAIKAGFPGQYTNGQWYHIALSRVGSILTLYIDGVPVGSAEYSGTINLASPNSFIGGGPSGFGNWNGEIDEIEIFNRGLAGGEIQAIFNAGSAGKCKMGCAQPPTEMIGWWQGNGNTTDIIGGNNGTVLGDVTYSPGMVGQAFSFDGNGDFINLDNLPVNPSPGAETTVDFWMYWNGELGQDGQMPFGFNSFDLYFYGPGFGFNTANSDVWGIPSQGLANRWVHVAAIFRNGNVTESRLFIDGIERALSMQNGTPGNGTVTSDARIGGWRLWDHYDFYGLIDEVEIFNRGLTPQEIQSIYRAGSFGKCLNTCTPPPPNMVSWYKAEMNAVDLISGFNGTPMNGAAYAPGKVGQAFNFDGYDDHIVVPHNDAQNTGAQITIDAWVKLNTESIGATIFQKRSPANVGGYVFEVNAPDPTMLQFVLMVGGTYHFAFTPPQTLKFGVWQHVAATYDGQMMRIYVDGIERAAQPLSGLIDPTQDPVVIGRNVVNPPFAWNGQIDEVELFNRALSQSEIQAIFNAGSAGKCLPNPTPTPSASPTPSPVPTCTPTGLTDNGPLVTHPGGGYNGADASAVQTALGLGVYGYGHSVANGMRVADDFAVPPGGWTLDSITVFAYQTGSSTTSTMTDVHMQIWNGPPNEPGSSVVFGDLVTNRLVSSTFSGTFRVLDTNLSNSDRPVMANAVAVDVTLPAGTYWIDWQAAGTLSSGPWAPPVTILDQFGKPGANALQFTGVWAPVVDGPNSTPQDFPFLVHGIPGSCSSPTPTPQPPGTADLAITKTDNRTKVTPGDTTTYTIVVTNNGPDPVVDAMVTDDFPEVLTVHNWNCVPQNSALCTLDGAGHIYDNVYLPVGGIVTYTATASIDEGLSGTLINTATVAPPQGITDPNPENNSATDIDNYVISLSGNVSHYADGDGTYPPLPGVTMTLTGSETATTTTDAMGNYTFTDLTSGGTWTVTPSMGDHHFEPGDRTVTGPVANVTGVDYLTYNWSGVPSNVLVVNTIAIPGNAVWLPIRMDAQGGERSMAFSLEYPTTAINTPELTCGESNPGCVIETIPGAIGKLGVKITGSSDLEAGIREIAVVRFFTNAVPDVPNAAVNFVEDPISCSVKDQANNDLPAWWLNGFVVFQAGYESDVAGRNTGDGTVVATDVTMLRRFIVGEAEINPAFNEFQRADSAPLAFFGDGELLPGDVVQARRFAAGLDPLQAAAGPGGPPLPPLGRPVTTDVKIADTNREIRAGVVKADPGDRVEVGIEISPYGDETAAAFTVEFNAVKLTNPRVTLDENGAKGLVLTVNMNDAAEGRIGVLLDSAEPLASGSEAKRLVTVTFDVAANAAGGETRIRFTDSLAKRGLSDELGNKLEARYTDGAVVISGPEADRILVAGRVMTEPRQGLRNAIVTITGPNGRVRATTTGTFGYYRFENVVPGVRYTVAVISRKYRFRPRVILPLEDQIDVNFIALE